MILSEALLHYNPRPWSFNEDMGTIDDARGREVLAIESNQTTAEDDGNILRFIVEAVNAKYPQGEGAGNV